MGLSQQSLQTLAKVGKMAFAAVAIGAAAATAAVVLLAKKSLTLAVDFDESMRKVNTLAKLGQEGFEGMKDRVLDLSTTLGKNATEMGGALYQVISACFEGADAMEVLKTGVKMATAGMAGQVETVDALTTVLNAWNLSADQAKKVADTFFLAIKYGKTTMGELAPTIGLVATMASQAGVSFEEVAAALSALTIVGVRTQRAVTGLNALFMAIVKPTDDAREAAKEMGFDLSTTALKTKGLVGFLKDLEEATGGNVEQMVRIIPNIRAVRAVLPLTSSAAEKFTSTLHKMRTETGSMEDAFAEMNRAYSRQIEVFKTKWTKALVDFGEAIWPMVAKSMKELSSPEILKAGELALLDIAEVITKAFSAIPLIIGTVKMSLESLHHVALKSHKTWLLMKTAVTDPWRTDVLNSYGDALFEVNKQLGESEGKTDNLAEEYGKLSAKLKGIIPPFDELRKKIKAKGIELEKKATPAIKENTQALILNNDQIRENIAAMNALVYEGIEPLDATLTEEDYLLRDLRKSARAADEEGLSYLSKATTKLNIETMAATGYVDIFGNALRSALSGQEGRVFDLAAAFRSLIIDIGLTIIKAKILQSLGYGKGGGGGGFGSAMGFAAGFALGGPIGGAFGSALGSAIFAQEGAYVKGLPIVNMKPQMVMANEPGAPPEVILPIDKLGKLIDVHIITTDPSPQVKILTKASQASWDHAYRERIKPAIIRDNQR
mgnify:CR=1 FL=1